MLVSQPPVALMYDVHLEMPMLAPTSVEASGRCQCGRLKGDALRDATKLVGFNKREVTEAYVLHQTGSAASLALDSLVSAGPCERR